MSRALKIVLLSLVVLTLLIFGLRYYAKYRLDDLMKTRVSNQLGPEFKFEYWKSLQCIICRSLSDNLRNMSCFRPCKLTQQQATGRSWGNFLNWAEVDFSYRKRMPGMMRLINLIGSDRGPSSPSETHPKVKWGAMQNDRMLPYS